MPFELPALPYAKNALAPHISAETFDYHYGKHHQAYVNKLNALTEGTENANKSLEELIRTTDGVLFNQAAQVWNHTFFWHSMAPNGGGSPSGDVEASLTRTYGGFGEFKDAFTDAAKSLFGSGWVWLVKSGNGLDIVTTTNAGNPMTDGKTPLLTLDVWEHAYYVDYRNARPKFIEAFLENLVNWDFVAQNLSNA